jgi:hypothetical protein
MRGVAGSAGFVGVALCAALASAAPRDPAPPAAAAAVAPAPPAEASTAPAPEPGPPACTTPTACAASPGAEESKPAPPAQPGAQLSDLEGLCQTLAAAAGANELPVDFFIRLIWQESRFDPKAVSRAGAQGVAQFMPATATWRGLADPFDPAEAIVKSAQLLRDLRREFGNLGLAAAAYNAGSGRVHDWLAGRRALPGETRAYVQIVTGRSAEEWTSAADDGTPQPGIALAVPCLPYTGVPAASLPRASPPARKLVEPWGVELVGSNSEAGALAAYRQLQRKYAAILAGHEPRVVFHGVIRQMGWARIRVDADTRANAQKLCAILRAAGAGCDVLRN